MAALLHPDSLSLFALDADTDADLDAVVRSLHPSGGTGAAPWNDPAFLAEASQTPARPALRLITGGLASDPAAEPAVVGGNRLRVLLGGLALAVLLALAALGAQQLLGADAAATGPASTAAVVHPIGVDATTTSSTPIEVVVQPGDTLWTIARSIGTSGDLRELVDRLQERAGGASVSVGQRIDISGLADARS